MSTTESDDLLKHTAIEPCTPEEVIQNWIYCSSLLFPEATQHDPSLVNDVDKIVQILLEYELRSYFTAKDLVQHYLNEEGQDNNIVKIYSLLIKKIFIQNPTALNLYKYTVDYAYLIRLDEINRYLPCN